MQFAGKRRTKPLWETAHFGDGIVGWTPPPAQENSLSLLGGLPSPDRAWSGVQSRCQAAHCTQPMTPHPEALPGVSPCSFFLCAGPPDADSPLCLPYKTLVSTVGSMVFSEGEAQRLIEILSEKAGVLQDTWHKVSPTTLSHYHSHWLLWLVSSWPGGHPRLPPPREPVSCSGYLVC